MTEKTDFIHLEDEIGDEADDPIDDDEDLDDDDAEDGENIDDDDETCGSAEETVNTEREDVDCDLRRRRRGPSGDESSEKKCNGTSPTIPLIPHSHHESSTPPPASTSSSSPSSLHSHPALAPLRLLLRVFNALPSKWRNWFVRGISGSALITGFGFIIHMGPAVLMILPVLMGIGCFHEVTVLSYNVHRASNVPLIRSLSWYYLFALLYFFYADSLARHANDYWSGAEVYVDETDGDRGGDGLTDFLEAVERFHPTTSFVLYVLGITVGFLPQLLKRGRRRYRGSGGGASGGSKTSDGGNLPKSSSFGDSNSAPRSTGSSASSPTPTPSPPSSSSLLSTSSSNSANSLLKKQFEIFAWAHMAMFFLVYPAHFAVVNMSTGGHLWFLIPVAIVIFNDIAAYAFGFFCGKTPLIDLSPKKTWEGFVGSGLSTLIFGALFTGWYLDNVLPATLTLKQLEVRTLKSGAAELRRRGVAMGVGVFGGSGGVNGERGGGEEVTFDEQSMALRRREIILRLDHYVCRVDVSGWSIVGIGGSSGGRSGRIIADRSGKEAENGGAVVGEKERVNWKAIAASTVCDRTAIMKSANYSMPQVVTSLWKTMSGRTVERVAIYPIQLHAFALSIFASLVAPFGGFFASGVKRAFNIKDFGAMIPGHGGLTDRFDCQCFMSFFVWAYHSSFVEPHYEGNDGEEDPEFAVDGGGGGRFTAESTAGGRGGRAGGFGRRRSGGVGGDPVGTYPLEIVKRVLELEAEDQLWLFERLRASLKRN